MRGSDNRLRWPARDSWIAFARYGILLSILWCIVYGGASYITSLHSFRVRLHSDAELRMPFAPSTAVIYLSLFPMLWMSVFVLHSPSNLKLFAKALAYLFVISGVGFILFPADDVRTREIDPDVFSQIYRFADWLNLSHNYMPSLHVGMAVLCASIYSKEASVICAIAIWIWALAITLSTLLTHEHYVIDLVAGGALGYLLANSIYVAHPHIR